MQSHSTSSPEHDTQGGWQTIRSLIPYLMEFKGRVMLAMSLLVFAKLANVAVPLVFKQIIDALDKSQAVLIVPAAL
ncbi:MAG: metal ABC transporter permease, partial [Nitrosomonadales bacterium]|nr:metal ABC transporter permease [Nitrosomonadales bacterium]